MCAFWATLTSDFDALWDDRAWYPSGLARCIARAARPNPKAPAVRPRGFFGYQKWWEYEAQVLIPYISNGPLIFWLYDVFSVRGASWFLGVSEWIFGALLFLGFWNKKLGILGAIGSCITFLMTITIIPFMPDGWAASAGGFPAMQGNVAFLMKDLVLFAVSFYLLKQDVMRASLSAEPAKAS